MELKDVRIVGTIIVHELGEVFHFSAARGCVTLQGEIRLSDRKHEIAAHIIARELDLLVIWQDMCGCKHFVRPDDELKPDISFNSSLDPRDVVCADVNMCN